MAHTVIAEYKKLDLSTNVLNSWEQASQKQQNVANARKTIITEFEELRATLSFSKAVKQFKENVHFQAVKSNVLTAITNLNGKVPSANTLKAWVDSFEQNGLAGLLPNHRGSQRKNYGWEHLALELYHKPQKPSLKNVALQLREDHGYNTATNHNVWYFFSLLPSELGDKSRWRIGTKLYRDGQRQFNLRHTENMQVGDIYQGDGHTLDVYLKHPSTGKLWRAELTVFQDWKSRYIVGWYLSNAESSITTMAALSHGLGTYNHVPLILYIDNGCGFKSQLMNDDTAGFYANFGMDVIFAIPGNAKAKGNVERFFRVMEEDLNKRFDTYCGADMSPDVSRHFSSAKMHIMEQKGIHVPAQEEWVEAFENWLIKYHNRPHPEYKNTTPAAMWAQLNNTPVHDMNLLVKPRSKVKVRRASIIHQGRTYRSTHLHQFNDQELVAEYDMHNDGAMRIFDNDGTYLLTVELAHKKAAIPTSRLDEQRERSRLASNKRLENKLRENNNRYLPAGSVHEQQLETLELIGNTEQSNLPEQSEPEYDLTHMMQSGLLSTEAPSEEEIDTLNL